MKISLNWLKTFVDITQSAEELEQHLTGTGLEVEHFETTTSVKGGMKGLVVGHVADCQKHPNADKLSLTKVDIGSGELLSIVCGAPNVAAGQKVIVAPVGTSIYPTKGEPFTINKAKIRGEASEGMLCAEDEIGLGTSHEGLLILPENLIIGSPVADYFKVTSDVVFDIGLTANRGDAASHLGVARELATVLDLPLNQPEYKFPKPGFKSKIEVNVADFSACLRYSFIEISGIQVKESPEWLKTRLNTIGVNSINNVVDATNFVMFELGQPLHAFDRDAITGQKVNVKKAVAGDKFTTLDNKEITLKGHELMIANAETDMCIAGVYGGKDSGVNGQTTNLFIESAYFSPDVVRKSAKSHGMNTDSSFRFERGTDPEMTIVALQRVAGIIFEIAGGKDISEIVDYYPEKIKPFDVTLRLSTIENICGFAIPLQKVEQILNGLAIRIVQKTENAWQLEVPVFKSDVCREIDVVEELIRIYGFQHIPLNKHMRMSLNYQQTSNERLQTDKVFHILQGMGFSEIMTNSLSNDKYYEEKKGLVYMANPLSAEMNVMRQSMLYSGLEVIAYNKNRKQVNTHFFEFGKTYRQANQKYLETEQLVIFASGFQTSESWELKQKPVDYYYLKSIVGRVCDSLGIESKHAVIQSVPESILRMFDINDSVYFATIQWEQALQQDAKKSFTLKPLPQFPVVRRDLSLIIDKQTEYKAIKAAVNQLNIKSVIGMNVFDIYEGKPLEEDKKSISISFELYDDEKTMNEKEIDAVMQKLMKLFEDKLNAFIRK